MNRKTKDLLIQNWWWEKDIKINQDMKDALIRCFTDFAKFLDVRKILTSKTLDKNEFIWMIHIKF